MMTSSCRHYVSMSSTLRAVKNASTAASPSVLALDIGGTRTKAAVIAGGRALGLMVADTDATEGAERFLDTLERQVRHLVRRHGPVTAIGVSVKGIVDPATGVLVDVNERLTGLIGTALGAGLGARFGVPACVDNDARMYTLGELRRGAGRGFCNLVCLTLGTGVGVGVVQDGRLLRGPRGTRGILGGHVTVQVDGPPCTCGSCGCLEALVGAPAIVRQVEEQLAAGRHSILPRGDFDAARVFDAAAAGDELARTAIDRFSHLLGCGIVTLINAHDTDLVLVGGGLSASAAQFLPAVRGWVTERAWTYPRGRVAVRVAELGDAAALMGAAELATGAVTWG